MDCHTTIEPLIQAIQSSTEFHPNLQFNFSWDTTPKAIIKIGTCNLRQFSKYFKEPILLTLNEITSRFGIYDRIDKSSNWFPQRFRFLMPFKLSFLVLVNINYRVNFFPVCIMFDLLFWTIDDRISVIRVLMKLYSPNYWVFRVQYSF